MGGTSIAWKRSSRGFRFFSSLSRVATRQTELLMNSSSQAWSVGLTRFRLSRMRG